MAAAPKSLKEAVGAPLAEFFSRPTALGFLAVIVLYKLGDAFASALQTAFLIGGLGFSSTEVGAAKGLGIVATLIGAFIGGLLMTRSGLVRSLLIFGVLQAVSNLGFVVLAVVGKSAGALTAAVVIENVTGGMGTAAFVALVMSLCDARYTATQFALLSSLEALGRVFVGRPSADLVEIVGWTQFFVLTVVAALKKQQAPREVVLVSKDINMRVKARALGLAAEDYQNDKTLDDGDLLYSGTLQLPPDFWTRQSKTVESWQSGSATYYRISGPIVPSLQINQFVFFESPGEPSLYARVTEIQGKTAVLRTLKDFTHLKNGVWGVTARNREQNFALNLLMDPEIDFVTLAGTAGTGKTLLALASGLTQVLDDRRYTEIIMTRATVSVGEDIGFLPGTEEEKMGPWMGALDDNLEFLAKGDGGNAGEWGRAATNELIRSRIKIKSMNFMRGRTFMNKWIIIDEAQNLTPKQMKTLITRAGPGTKIICMGNLAQIDTPYLTEGSSGMTFAVDRFKGWGHGGHVTLARGERSRLADFASEVL